MTDAENHIIEIIKAWDRLKSGEDYPKDIWMTWIEEIKEQIEKARIFMLSQ